MQDQSELEGAIMRQLLEFAGECTKAQDTLRVAVKRGGTDGIFML